MMNDPICCVNGCEPDSAAESRAVENFVSDFVSRGGLFSKASQSRQYVRRVAAAAAGNIDQTLFANSLRNLACLWFQIKRWRQRIRQAALG